MFSEGEVYYDHTFDGEMTILSIEDSQTTLDGPVGGSEPRTTDKWRVEHNISVGRYEKLRETEVEKSVEEKATDESIFNY